MYEHVSFPFFLPRCSRSVLVWSSCSELQMFALSLNIKCWFKSLFHTFFFFFFFFRWRIGFRLRTKGLHQLCRSADTAAPFATCLCGNLNRQNYDTALRWIHMYMRRWSPLTVWRQKEMFRPVSLPLHLSLFTSPSSFHPPPPHSSLIYLSSLPATPPLTSVLPALASLPPAQTINIMSRGWQCSFMEHCMFIRGRRSLREMLTVFINGPHPRLMRHGTS